MLQEFNAENTPNVRPKDFFLTYNGKGVFKLTAHAVEGLQLKAGDKIALAQDTKRPQDWYLLRSDKGYTLHYTNKESKNLQFNSASLVRILNRSLNQPDNLGLKIKLGNEWYQEQGVTVVSLLTKAAVSNMNKAA